MLVDKKKTTYFERAFSNYSILRSSILIQNA